MAPPDKKDRDKPVKYDGTLSKFPVGAVEVLAKSFSYLRNPNSNPYSYSNSISTPSPHPNSNSITSPIPAPDDPRPSNHLPQDKGPLEAPFITVSVDPHP